ncbi:sexual stage surface protein Pvs28 [Plasmodium gonderi]|uniref:Ookinete surface protein P28 n=1 Tax=Plasmodium gonderi TaxID=77519 RepID=A0A1B0WVP2_PLAGO|nr:sexual stage surface protein Pvs28 [Plasmodium gonderi]AND94972.1 ookinete surface protein P28 [Plasmodium gonderi]GAW80009.1 sexual stage surface protein Pvs28 [Plasmodium gonderi]
MNTYYSLFVFFVGLLAIKYAHAKVTADTVCKNGYLIQMSNHFECKCNVGFVLLNENTCEQKLACSNVQNLNKSCDDYAICSNASLRADEKAAICTCIKNYVFTNQKCISNVCNKIVCDKGKCVIDPANVNNSICSCDIGTVLDESKKCGKPGKTECTLKCKSGEVCELIGTFYKCVVKGSGGGGNGGEGSGGESSGGEGNPEQSGAVHSIMNRYAQISILIVFAFFMMTMV